MPKNYKNIFIGNLFPSNADKKKSNTYDRIIKFLGEENLYWALLFCFTVINREDYNEIKKHLNRIRLDILTDYHESLQSNLENKAPEISFISYLEAIDTIRTICLRLAYNESKRINEEITKLDTDDLKETAYDLLISTLKDKSNEIIESTTKKFNEEVKNKVNVASEYIKDICLLESNKISSYILNDCREYYRSYKYKKDSNKRSVINEYEIASKKRLTNSHRMDVHRVGKSLFRNR